MRSDWVDILSWINDSITAVLRVRHMDRSRSWYSVTYNIRTSKLQWRLRGSKKKRKSFLPGLLVVVRNSAIAAHDQAHLWVYELLLVGKEKQRYKKGQFFWWNSTLFRGVSLRELEKNIDVKKKYYLMSEKADRRSSFTSSDIRSDTATSIRWCALPVCFTHRLWQAGIRSN